jgi:hypothetical protein
MPTVLRLTGPRDRICSALGEFSLGFEESVASVRERRLNPDAVIVNSTYNLTVSDAPGDSVPAQLSDCLAYFRSNSATIKKLVAMLDDSALTLDVSWDFPRSAIGQYNTVNTDLMEELASLRISLMFSVYGTRR